jgi:hypothetical protein
MQLDDGDAPGKITADIVDAYVQASHCEAFALRSDHHTQLLWGLAAYSFAAMGENWVNCL